MGHDHLNQRLLKAFFDRELSPMELVALLIQHLEELCPVCRAEIAAWTEERETHAGDTALYQFLTGALLRSMKVELEWLERLRPLAEKEARELMALPRRKRRGKIERATKRFRNPVLIDLLLQQCRDLVSIDPREAEEVAELAHQVALRLPDRYGSDVFQSCLARTRSFRANAARVAGDLRRAGEVLQEVLDYIDLLPDPLVRAEIWSFGASLRKDQRRFEEAEELHQLAMTVYQELGTPVQQAQILISRANLAHERGRIGEAIDLLRETTRVLPPGKELRLELFVSHNLAWYLCEAGRHTEAQKVKASHQHLYARFPEPSVDCRDRWLQGKISAGLGRVDEAEESFLQVRDRLTEAGVGIDAALVSLDLALLYMEQGRSGDVKRLAEEMLPVFRSQDVHREALASLLLFQKAALAEKVSFQMVKDLAAFLESSRDQGSLRHETPS